MKKPYNPKKPCARINCVELVQTTERFCKLHKEENKKETLKQWNHSRDSNRPSSGERGYDYQWTKFRKRFVMERVEAGDYYCNHCHIAFRSTTDMQVDHIKPLQTHPDLKFEKTNLQLLCRKCHIQKTKEDNK